MTLTEGTAGNLVWAGTSDNAVWNYNSTNTNWEIGGSRTGFMKGDNVTFTSGAGEKTVSLENGSSLIVGNMTVESGAYELILGSNGMATVSGEKLTIARGASLILGDQGNNVTRKVSLNFNQISVGGSLQFKTTGAHSWDSLTFKEGGNLHLIDGTGGQIEPHLSISAVNVAGNATITAEWDKKLKIDSLSGEGGLVVTGATSGNGFTVSLGDISSYSGAATFNNGNTGLIVNFTGDTSVNSAAKLVFNSGVTVNNTRTLTLDGEIALSGSINNTGTVSVSEDVKFDIGQMTATNGVYTFVSGGTITDSWTLLDESNFSQNGAGLARGTFSNSGNLGEITFAAAESKRLTWSGQDGIWDYNNTQSWKDSSDASETFYTNDSVVFDTNNAAVTVSGLLAPTAMEVATTTAFSGTGTVKVSNGALSIATGSSLALGANVVLDLGIQNNGTLNANITGTGTIVWGNDAGGHGSTISLSDEFTGTLELSGKISSASEQLKLGGTTKITSQKGVWFWGGSIDSDSLAFEFTGGKNEFTHALKAGELNISGGETYFSGKTRFGTLTVGSNAVVVLKKQEILDYDATTQRIVLEGGVLNISEGTRQTVGSGTTFEFNGGVISQTGTSIVDGSEYGALDIMGVHTGDNAIKVTANTDFSASLRIRGDLEFNISNDVTLAMSGVIDPKGDESKGWNDGSIFKTGDGVMCVSGNNSSYNGGFTISAGTLVAGNANALGTGAVKVVSGAKLQADVAVTLSSNLTLVVSESDKGGAGLISGAGVTIADTAKLLVDIQNLTLPSSGDANNELALNIAAANALMVDQDQIQLGAWIDNVWSNYDGEWFVQSWDNSTGTLTLAIPEPSLFGLLAGLGALALVGTRRRKKV